MGERPIVTWRETNEQHAAIYDAAWTPTELVFDAPVQSVMSGTDHALALKFVDYELVDVTGERTRIALPDGFLGEGHPCGSEGDGFLVSDYPRNVMGWIGADGTSGSPTMLPSPDGSEIFPYCASTAAVSWVLFTAGQELRGVRLARGGGGLLDAEPRDLGLDGAFNLFVAARSTEVVVLAETRSGLVWVVLADDGNVVSSKPIVLAPLQGFISIFPRATDYLLVTTAGRVFTIAPDGTVIGPSIEWFDPEFERHSAITSVPSALVAVIGEEYLETLQTPQITGIRFPDGQEPEPPATLAVATGYSCEP